MFRVRSAVGGVSLCLLALMLAGCATAPRPAAPGLARSVELEDVPFHRQRARHCGPAALAMVLNWSGVEVDPDQLAPSLYIPERGGTLQPELAAQSRAHGRLAYILQPRLEALLAELQAGHPVLVLQNLAFNWWPRWHYAVVVGYDADSHALVLRSGDERRRVQPAGTFMRTWRRGGHWGMVVLPPSATPASAQPISYLRAAFDLEQTQGPAAARSSYAAGRARWPESAEFVLALANATYRTEGAGPAAHVLQRALARGLRDGMLYNNLALLLAEQGRGDEALTMAERAVAAGGRHATEFHQTLESLSRKGPHE